MRTNFSAMSTLAIRSADYSLDIQEKGAAERMTAADSLDSDRTALHRQIGTWSFEKNGKPAFARKQQGMATG